MGAVPRSQTMTAPGKSASGWLKDVGSRVKHDLLSYRDATSVCERRITHIMILSPTVVVRHGADVFTRETPTRRDGFCTHHSHLQQCYFQSQKQLRRKSSHTSLSP